MPRKRLKPRHPGTPTSEITIDVDEVNPDSKLSELTVAQFVELLAQSYAQMVPPHAAPRRRRTEFGRRLVAALSSESEAAVSLKNALRDIAKALPQILLEISRQLKEEAEQGQAERQEKPDNE